MNELSLATETTETKMGRKLRFAFGFVLGLILSACALFLTGAGHGTYAPIIANASFLALIPGLGILLALAGTPFLWAIYFLVIPEIDSRPGRVIALVLISLLHVVPGVWLASEDHAFTRALESHPMWVIAHGLALVAAIISLTIFTSWERKPKEDV
jgi:heme/copper-type cytochrome/quinol oxidase subunit 4